EQYGRPQEIYDRPASLFVADFIGSPPMNVLPLEASLAPGAAAVTLAGAEIAMPALREGAAGRLTLGVRPEHVRLADDGPLRARVTATEYLGTTQIVSLETEAGPLKARLSSATPVAAGAQTGLAFDPRRLSLFGVDGRAVPSALHEEAAHG
ncbi:MAG: TOBE domain-containing protein, partial [Pseudomonadota bacterium]